MAPSKLRSAIGAVKDKTSIGLAKVGSHSVTELEVAIVKATRHEEYPPDERYVREILSLTTYQRAYVNASVITIARRLNKTKNWVVALKTLMLIHRLLTEGDIAYEQEIFFATRRGTRLLNMSDFRDASGKTNAWDYSAFVRTYALYLDEQLEYRMQARRGKCSGYTYQTQEVEEGEDSSKQMVVRATPVREMTNERLFPKIHHLMQLLERFMACRPTGAAKHNRVVAVALYPIVKESFQLYHDITEILGVLIDRFMDLEVPDMVRVHEIFSRVSKQYDELDEFYIWCKSVGIENSSQYPAVEKIPQSKLDMMDKYINNKTVMLRNKQDEIDESKPEPVEETQDEEPEQDMNEIKALPPPEGFEEEKEEKEDEEEKEVEEPKEEEETKTQEVGDLLNLGEDAPSKEEHGDQLALALFDGCPATTAPESTISPWEAFKDSTGDWETALVQSASHLSNQKASLPGGFDTLMLDGMYKHGATVHAVAASGVVPTGSASSVALGSAGRPAMLALPAPPDADGEATSSSVNVDPFAASLAIAPPAYVQLTELEKKQRSLVEEQLMWQQYARDGRQGQVGIAKVQPQYNTYPYNAGGYTRTY